MLQFVVGRAGSGKTYHLRQLLADRSREAAGFASGGLMMIVPEQYSFAAEKDILNRAGAKYANRIDVVSFTRLAETVFRREGGIAGKRLSDGGRRMLMNMAVASCTDHLDLYAEAARDGRIIELMLTAVNEMKLCGISARRLRETASVLPEKGLSGKLREISLIYDTYEALVAGSYLDPRDDLTRLAETLAESDFFTGMTVVVDSFEGFTAQETAVLVQIMKKADDVIVSLCTDNMGDGKTGLFALVNQTKDKLKRAAKENGVKIRPDDVMTDAPRFQNKNLAVLERNLFCAEEFETAGQADGIRLFAARDVYEEADFVSATIRNLVMDEGYEYGDFSIICRNPERYGGCLGVALAKRDIPCFISMPERVDAEPVMRFVLGAFEAVLHGFGTDEIFEMLKTGVSGLSAEEIAALENYSFLWRLRGSEWREPFVRHPRGFGQEMTDEDAAHLQMLNGLRARIIMPLIRFAGATKDASGEEMSGAVYALLCDFHMEETVPAYCARLEQAGETGLAAKQVRIWDLLMRILDEMRSILGGRKITRERYYALLREVVGGEDVSDIPQVLDEVLFGTPEQVRQSAPKVTFLIGAVQGEFPLVPKSSGVFSDAERKKLIEQNLPLGDPLEMKTMEERYLAYSVACSPSEKLVVCYPKSADGEAAEPSELLNGIRGIFPSLDVEEKLPVEYYANAREAAFSEMAAVFTKGTAEAASLRKLFEGDTEYAGRIAALERAAGGKPEEITEAGLPKQVFGETPYFSASQIERYHSCHFRYFCQYGLNARERWAAEIDAMQYGTIMHYLFEAFFASDRQGKPPLDLTEEEMEETVRTLIIAYADTNMGGYEAMSGREKYRFDRLIRSAAVLIRHVAEELEQSSFVPAHFELKLGKDGGMPPIRIQTPQGNTAVVGGTIDRVDIYETHEGRFVRVVDYKTGIRRFRLADVLYGMNMQMLVYLAALIENGGEIPAGVLYMPLAEPAVSVPRGTGEEELRAEAKKELKMNGLVLSDAEIIRAMEGQAAGRYIPVSLKKDGEPRGANSLLRLDEFYRVLDYSKRLIASMADELLGGDVRAEPMMKNENSCAYCPYGAVCGKEYDDSDVQEEKIKKDEILKRMDDGRENGSWRM